MEWISIKNKLPEWGTQILVYRGKIDHPESWKFNNVPPVFDITNRFDSNITHWIAIPMLPKKEDE